MMRTESNDCRMVRDGPQEEMQESRLAAVVPSLREMAAQHFLDQLTLRTTKQLNDFHLKN